MTNLETNSFLSGPQETVMHDAISHSSIASSIVTEIDRDFNSPVDSQSQSKRYNSSIDKVRVRFDNVFIDDAILRTFKAKKIDEKTFYEVKENCLFVYSNPGYCYTEVVCILPRFCGPDSSTATSYQDVIKPFEYLSEIIGLPLLTLPNRVLYAEYGVNIWTQGVAKDYVETFTGMKKSRKMTVSYKGSMDKPSNHKYFSKYDGDESFIIYDKGEKIREKEKIHTKENIVRLELRFKGGALKRVCGIVPNLNYMLNPLFELNLWKIFYKNYMLTERTLPEFVYILTGLKPDLLLVLLNHKQYLKLCSDALDRGESSKDTFRKQKKKVEKLLSQYAVATINTIEEMNAIVNELDMFYKQYELRLCS